MDQKFALVSPSLLLPPLKDKRDRTSPAYREWLATLTLDVKARGVRNPVQVKREGDKFRVLAGYTRMQAAMLAALDRIPINILERDLTEGQMALETALENWMRRPLSDMEQAETILELMELNNWTQAETARHLGISPGQVSKVMAVSAKLPDELKAMIGSGEGKIGPRAAYQLSRLSEVAVMKELAERLVRGCLKVESLEAEVGRRIGKGRKKTESLKLKCGEVVIVVTGNPVEGLKAFLAKLGEAIKKLERDGADPKYLPALLKGA
jgi:ParB family chromosome partitioning protein